MTFLEKVDEKIKPLVNSIDGYIRGLKAEKTLSLYDADWGGIPIQVMLDKICEKVHGTKPRSYWITYLHTAKPIEFAQKNDFTDAVFLDYEPHEDEIDKICKNTGKIGIFGHHKDRNDIRELCRENPRFSYFNTRDLDDDINEGSYRRGVPILYPFLKVGELHDIEKPFIGALGLRGYGYKKLYDEMYSGKARPGERSIDPVIENVNLLISHRLENCSRVVRALSRADNLKDEPIKELNRMCGENKLADKKNKIIGNAIMNSVILGDVQLFPIRTDFEIIKAFVADLNERRRRAGLGTTIAVQYVNNIPRKLRKISIRTSKKVDVPELLRKAHQDQTEKNYGGHERSGGFISSERNTRHILENMLTEYFSQTGYSERVDFRELSSL